VSPLPRPAGCQLNASKRASGLFCRPTRNRWTAKSSRTVVGRRPATRLKRGGQREVAMQSEGATKVAGRNRRSGLRAGRQWTCVVPCRPATERTVCPPLSNYSFLIIVRNSKKMCIWVSYSVWSLDNAMNKLPISPSFCCCRQHFWQFQASPVGNVIQPWFPLPTLSTGPGHVPQCYSVL